MPNDNYEFTQEVGAIDLNRPARSSPRQAVQVNRPYLNRRRPIIMIIAIRVIPAHIFANSSPWRV
jgi:hypothetical protein